MPRKTTKRRRSDAVKTGVSGPPTLFPNKVPTSLSFTATKENRQRLKAAQRRERLSRSDVINLLIALHADTVTPAALTAQW